MELDSKVKYFQSPPVVREGTPSATSLVAKQEDPNNNSCKMASAPDSSVGEGIADSAKNFIIDSEADTIYKRLKSESESQAALNMYATAANLPQISSKTKKKWREDESNLLLWAVHRITQTRGLSSTQLVGFCRLTHPLACQRLGGHRQSGAWPQRVPVSLPLGPGPG